MTGKIYTSIFPFYDSIQHKMSFKSRPVLIIAESDETDYVVLPLSRVTCKDYLDSYYDIEVNPQDYPLLNLRAVSYIRVHKQIVIHAGELGKEIADLKKEYPDIFLMVLERMEEFQKKIIDNALS
ncbi:MAG: hypothetical protein LUG99_13635 [Lachnospiraceae bacterium]|nr:hypothetical protein [Lachnospiraceae bacterium]